MTASATHTTSEPLPQAGTEPSWRRAVNRSSILNGALLCVLIAPFAFNAARWVGATWHPAQDFAALEARVRSVLTLHPPALGAFSRYGWSHPGPVWYWLLTPLYFVAGRQPWALVSGANLVEAGVLVVGWLYARRLNPRFGPLCFTAASLMPYWWTGTSPVQMPWNPFLAIPFVLTTLVGALGGLELDPPGLALMVVSWSVLLQLHIGYASSVTPIVIFVLARAVYLLRRSGTLHVLWGRSAKMAVSAVTLMWLPPIAQEFAHYPGNLSHLISFSLHGSRVAGPKAGVGFAVRTVSEGFRLPTSFSRGLDERFAFNKWLLPHGGSITAVAVLLVCAAAVVLLPASQQRRLSAVAVAFVGTATLSVSQVSGERWGYLFDFVFVAASLAWVAAAGALVTLAIRWLPRFRIAAVAAVEALVLVLVVAIAAGQIIGLKGRDHRVAADEADGWTLASHALEQTPATGVVVSTDFGGLNELGLNDALLNEANRRHKNVRADIGNGKFGARMTASQTSASEIWKVSEDGFSTTLLLSLPGARVVSLVTPLSPGEEARLEQAQLRVGARLAQANRTDLLPALNSALAPVFLRGVSGLSSDDVDLISSLSTKISTSGHCRCAVVAFATGTQPSSPDAALATLLPTIGAR